MSIIKCDCGNRLIVEEKEEFSQEINGEEYIFQNYFVLECPDCQKIIIPSIIKSITEGLVCMIDKSEDKSRKGNFKAVANHFWDREYNLGLELPFCHSIEDYYSFPGLYRSHNVGFLTLIFFNIEVLYKYCYHPDYSIELGANSYGSIYDKEGHLLSFGINQNNHIIMWAGDISKLSIKEQYYLLSENIPSDHDISSEFYEAQIEVQWAEPSEFNQIFLLKKEVAHHINDKNRMELYFLDRETLNVVKDIKPMISGTKTEFENIINSLNMILVESINSKEIKKYLTKNYPDDEYQVKGIKLLKKYFDKISGIENEESLLTPLFILYDLRICFSHLQSNTNKEEKIKYSLERLSIEENCSDYKLILNKLVAEINTMFNKLILIASNYKNEQSGENGI